MDFKQWLPKHTFEETKVIEHRRISASKLLRVTHARHDHFLQIHKHAVPVKSHVNITMN